MELPEAYIRHQSTRRIRIKIASRKGNAGYFDRCRNTLERFRSFERMEVNLLTGSILVVGENVDIDALAEYGKTQRLFNLRDRNSSPAPMTRQLVSRLENLSTGINRLSLGEMDLAGILLLLLLISGFAELLRGKIRMPPWYTAFWYAFGIYQLASVVKEKGQDAG